MAGIKFVLLAAPLLMAVFAHDTADSDFSCAGKNPGNYEHPAVQCSHVFYSCTAEQYPATELQCPSGLYFNVDLDLCLKEEDVPSCGGTNPPPTTTKKPVDDDTEKIAFDCTTRRSGQYAHPDRPCSATYISCANGRLIVHECPGNLKFDPKSKRCLEDQWIEPCGGTATPLPDPATTRAPVTGVTCPSEANQFIENPHQPCGALYYACVLGRPFEMMCPRNLCFDSTSVSCLEPLYVRACGGSPTTTAVPTTTQADPSKPQHECLGHPVGPYFVLGSCADIFLHCAAADQKYADVLYCSTNTKFDSERQRCDFFANIPECTGLPRPQTTTPQEDEEKVQIPNKYLPPAGYCSARADGNYPTAYGANYCSRYFLTCSGGEAVARACPLGLSYDPLIDECDFTEDVPVCTGLPRPAQPPTTTTKPAPPVNFDCSGRADGNYAAGACADLFYLCSGGRASSIACPAGTRYDSGSDECREPLDVRSCPHSDEDFVTCVGRPDGFYGFGEASCDRYVLCRNQEPFAQRCFNNEVFHQGLHQCLPRDNVPEPCGTMPLADEFTCENREVGYYRNENNCGAYFYCESDGSVWSFECSIGKAFDFTTGQCQGLFDVPDCFTQPPPVLDRFCRRSGDGLFAHPEECHTGVVCLTGIPFELPCPIDTRSKFDESVLDCVDNDDTCPARPTQ